MRRVDAVEPTTSYLETVYASCLSGVRQEREMFSSRQKPGILSLIQQRSLQTAKEEPVSADRARDGLQSSVQISRALAAERVPYICCYCKSTRLRCRGRPLRMFFYEELKKATGNFSYENYLAKTESGHVFRGTLEGGELVAVKITQDESVFKAQRFILDNVSSVNLVSLIGFCDERIDRRLLVYDFVCNGSLESHLTGGQKVLPWAWRKHIAIGVARGLKHLHESCSIEHRNLRSEKVFLTHDYTPMITGMGSARVKAGYSFPGKDEANDRCDIYAYGVILIELISGRETFDRQALIEWAVPLLREVDHEKLIDPKLDYQYNHYELLSMMTVASLCLRSDRLARPTSGKILGLLEDDGERVFSSSEDEATDSTLSQASSLPCLQTSSKGLSYATML